MAYDPSNSRRAQSLSKQQSARFDAWLERQRRVAQRIADNAKRAAAADAKKVLRAERMAKKFAQDARRAERAAKPPPLTLEQRALSAMRRRAEKKFRKAEKAALLAETKIKMAELRTKQKAERQALKQQLKGSKI